MLYIDRENLLIPYKGNQTALAAIEEAGKGPYEWAMEPDLCEVLFEEAECRLDLEKQKKSIKALTERIGTLFGSARKESPVKQPHSSPT